MEELLGRTSSFLLSPTPTTPFHSCSPVFLSPPLTFSHAVHWKRRRQGQLGASGDQHYGQTRPADLSVWLTRCCNSPSALPSDSPHRGVECPYHSKNTNPLPNLDLSSFSSQTKNLASTEKLFVCFLFQHFSHTLPGTANIAVQWHLGTGNELAAVGTQPHLHLPVLTWCSLLELLQTA